MNIADNGYTFVDQATWGARHSAGRRPMPRPVSQVWIHHTVTAPTGDPCADARQVEDVLASRSLDPGYSYLIHPSGVVLEGAGRNVGAHTAKQNSRSYGLGFIGNYSAYQPTLAALVAAARTVNLLRMDGALVAPLVDVGIGGHRDVKATACPGDHLYPLIRYIRWFAGTNA